MLCRFVLRLYMLVIPNQVRGEALGGGNVAGSNGKPCRTNGQRGHDCRCFGGPAKGAKGTLDKSVAGSIHHQYIALYKFLTLCFFRCCCRIHIVLPCRTPPVQASNRCIQPADAKTHQGVSNGRYVAHQTDDRIG